MEVPDRGVPVPAKPQVGPPHTGPGERPARGANFWSDETGTSSVGQAAKDLGRRIFAKRDEVEQYSSWGEKHWRWKNRPGLLLTGEPLDRGDLPDTLYHVTVAGEAVRKSGYLMGQKSDAGMGGGQAEGVSFTTSMDDAKLMQRELTRAVKLARGDVKIDGFEGFAREDERIGGLPQGALGKSAQRAMEWFRFNIENYPDTYHDPAKASDLAGQAYNQYLNSRESAMYEHLGGWAAAKGDAGPLKNPVLFGDRAKLAKVDPAQIHILEIPSRNIPDESLVTSGSDKFLHEVRAYSDVRMPWEPTGEKYSSERKQSIAAAISTGKITPDEAYKRDLHFTEASIRDWKPLPQDKPMYHVTTSADAVEKGGLKSRFELGQDRGAGLGGGGQYSVSFTDDPETANGIRRGILEAQQVASGKVSLRQLIEQAERGEGANRPYIEEVVRHMGGGGSGTWKPGQPYPAVLDNLFHGVERTGGTMGDSPRTWEGDEGHDWKPVTSEYHWTGGDGKERYGVWERKLSPEEIRDQTFQLYKALSQFREYAGGPLNPLFFLSDVDALAKMDPRSVAVMEYRARPGTRGTQESALGEWRTYSGEAVKLVKRHSGEIGPSGEAAPLQGDRPPRPE